MICITTPENTYDNFAKTKPKILSSYTQAYLNQFKFLPIIIIPGFIILWSYYRSYLDRKKQERIDFYNNFQSQNGNYY
jgi:hypothetical protein